MMLGFPCFMLYLRPPLDKHILRVSHPVVDDKARCDSKVNLNLQSYSLKFLEVGPCEVIISLFFLKWILFPILVLQLSNTVVAVVAWVFSSHALSLPMIQFILQFSYVHR